MSKFREPPPPGHDEKVVPFPASGEMTPAQREAELARFQRQAGEELLLRMKYNTLLRILDTIKAYDPVPDDWRNKL